MFGGDREGSQRGCDRDGGQENGAHGAQIQSVNGCGTAGNQENRETGHGNSTDAISVGPGSGAGDGAGDGRERSGTAGMHVGK